MKNIKLLHLKKITNKYGDKISVLLDNNYTLLLPNSINVDVD